MSGRFVIAPTALRGVVVIERRPRGDDRGWFERLFCADELAAVGFGAGPVQINRTLTRRRGAVRGLHFQRPPCAEVKLISCLRGRVLDVVVDLRRGSPTFGGWAAAELSAENRRSMLAPQGCAHGFQTLEDDCELLYLHSAPHAPDAEGGVHHACQRLAIAWPEPVTALSERDAALPPLDPGFEPIAVETDR